MTEYTPGPWYTERVTIFATQREETIVCARNDSHWPSSGRTIAAVGHWRDRIDPEADARLIEAAPDLLAALISAEAVLEEVYLEDSGEESNSPDVVPALKITRAAIAKATEDTN